MVRLRWPFVRDPFAGICWSACTVQQLRF